MDIQRLVERGLPMNIRGIRYKQALYVISIETSLKMHQSKNQKTTEKKVNALDPQHKKQNKNKSESKTSTCIEHNKNKLIQLPTNNQNIKNTLRSHHHTQSTKNINKI
jgi:hypothetical protein